MLGSWIVFYGAYSQSSEMPNVDSSAVLTVYFISKNGHLAHVKGSSQMVIAAQPETHRALAYIFNSLTVDNFDGKSLKNKLLKNIKVKNTLVRKTVDLQYLNAKILIPALRRLVSFEGSLSSNKKGKQLEISDYPAYINDIVRLIKKLDSTIN